MEKRIERDWIASTEELRADLTRYSAQVERMLTCTRRVLDLSGTLPETEQLVYRRRVQDHVVRVSTPVSDAEAAMERLLGWQSTAEQAPEAGPQGYPPDEALPVQEDPMTRQNFAGPALVKRAVADLRDRVEYLDGTTGAIVRGLERQPNATLAYGLQGVLWRFDRVAYHLRRAGINMEDLERVAAAMKKGQWCGPIVISAEMERPLTMAELREGGRHGATGSSGRPPWRSSAKDQMLVPSGRRSDPQSCDPLWEDQPRRPGLTRQSPIPGRPGGWIVIDGAIGEPADGWISWGSTRPAG
jgi:hypothetical protein